MKKFYLLLHCTFFCSILIAQPFRNEPFIRGDNTKLKLVENARIQSSLLKHLIVPARYDKVSAKLFTEEREKLRQNITAMLDKDALFDDELWPYVKSIHSKIISVNPKLPPTHVFVVAEPEPNAFSVGDGTLVLFTGLLAELENEEQLAFVLCHEMAHFVLQHSAKQLTKEIDRFQSKTFKEDLKKIQTAKYNQSELLEKLITSTQFNSRYHHRDLERQADSLAYHLYINTIYDPLQAQRLMELFKTIDEPVKDSTLQLDGYFGCSQYPFKKLWLNNGKTSAWEGAFSVNKTINLKLADSLSTHPNAAMRSSWLSHMELKLHPAAKEKVKSDYQKIRFLSALENTNSAYLSKQYDLTIYLALLYHKVYPECSYFKSVVALTLNGLYQHSKNHNLSNVLSQSSPYYAQRYNDLLLFLNNLGMSDFLELQGCVVNQNKIESEFGLYASYCFSMAKENSSDALKIKKKYLSMYPFGRFSKSLKVDN